MGGVDKIVRLLVALVMIIAYYREIVSGIFGIVLLVLTAIFVITSLTGVCPIYSLFGINSCPPKKQ